MVKKDWKPKKNICIVWSKQKLDCIRGISFRNGQLELAGNFEYEERKIKEYLACGLHFPSICCLQV